MKEVTTVKQKHDQLIVAEAMRIRNIGIRIRLDIAHERLDLKEAIAELEDCTQRLRK